MGKGFQEHSYTLKKECTDRKMLKSKEAIYWEEIHAEYCSYGRSKKMDERILVEVRCMYSGAAGYGGAASHRQNWVLYTVL